MSSTAPKIEDPTYYPVEDELGEHELQMYILELLRPLLARLMSVRGITAHVGSDQYIYWREYAPTECLAPDIYVLPGVSQSIAIETWKVWERGGIVPSFALEVVSSDWRKDYTDNLRKYERLGVKELITFDPFAGGRLRVPWRVFRRSGELLVLAEESSGDRVASEVLECWFRVLGTGDERRLRVGLAPHGEELFPTAEEAERLAKEAERLAKEAERLAKEAALERIRELEAELKRRG